LRCQTAGARLKQYRAHLNAAQIAHGINAAIRTARRLAEDARLLFDNGRFATAASIAILAIEEAGKVSILRAFSIAKEHELKDGWKHYRSHTEKNRMTAIFDYLMQGANKLEDFRGLFSKDAEHTQAIDNVKQLGFYSDCLGNANWSEPTNVVDEKLARFLVTLAEALVKGEFATEKEIELWAKHLGPVSKDDMAAMTEALGNWNEDMQRHGLASEGENEMRRFAVAGIRGPKPH
jgi:AbiV family abortive infection protein